MSSYIVGWDIGGSHVKTAVLRRADGVFEDMRQYNMPLWRGVGWLDRVLRRAWRNLPPGAIRHAITMTAELADVFQSRRDGVREVVAATRRLAPRAHTRFYSQTDGFIDRASAERRWEGVASANWHASLAFVGSALSTGGLLVDVGGTTTDILPFADGEGVAKGTSDRERLENGELLYSGVLRTPLATLCDRVPYEGGWVRVCSERFADTADVYGLLGWIRPAQDQGDTADGKGKDRVARMRRLARMIGLDWRPGADSSWLRLAHYFAECQLDRMRKSLAQTLSRRPDAAACLIGAGCGSFLARRLALRHALAYMEFADLPGVRLAEGARSGKLLLNDRATAAAIALLMWGKGE